MGKKRAKSVDIMALERRAKSGDVEAQYELAAELRSGVGEAWDGAAAIRWLERSVAQGHSGAANLLAECRACGRCMTTSP